MTAVGRSGSDGGINKELVNPDHFAGARQHASADSQHLGWLITNISATIVFKNSQAGWLPSIPFQDWSIKASSRGVKQRGHSFYAAAFGCVDGLGPNAKGESEPDAGFCVNGRNRNRKAIVQWIFQL